MSDTLKHFKRYPRLVTVLNNIYDGMKNDSYDCPFIISGNTGNGKSMLLLHIIELWYKVILKQKLSVTHIKHVQNTREGWIKNFKEIEAFDIGANDEGTNALMSKETMQRFNVMLNKLYNVFRKKLFFTIILIPDYFELPLWFRKRVRGCIEVDKRGQFRYYTQTDLYYVNSLNENKLLKTMRRAKPHFSGIFPDYTGILRDPYDNMASISSDTIIDELITDTKVSNANSVNIYYDRVVSSIKDGRTQVQICKELHISPRTYTQIRKRMLIKENTI